VDENMKRAHKIDAVNNQLFYFRRFMAPLDCSDPSIAKVFERASSDVPSFPKKGSQCCSSESETSPSAPSETEPPVDAPPCYTCPSAVCSSSSLSHPSSSLSLSLCLSVSLLSQKWPGTSVNNSYEEMTIDEIFNGKDCYFPGLLPLVYAYLEFVKCDEETFAKIDQYLKFVSLSVSSPSMQHVSFSLTLCLSLSSL
jgi:hypothetical protein